MSSRSHITVLMTGAGAPGAPGILRCLRQDERIRVIGCDADPEASGRFMEMPFYQVPPASSPDFIKTVYDICTSEKVDALLPLVTRELLPLSEAQDKFKDAGTHVLVNEAEVLHTANDKGVLYRELHEKGIAVPAFRIAEDMEDFESALEALKYPRAPVIFKPCVSNGSRGFRVLDPRVNEADLLFNHKPDSTHITADNARRILSSQPFPPLLVSEYLPGNEYSVDCLADHGKTIIAIPRLRRKMIGGISVQGEIVHQPEIIAYAGHIIRALNLHGNIGIQVKANADGQYLILEINPRVQGTIVACLGAGVNLPLLGIYLALGEPVLPGMLEVQWGTRFKRYWNEVYY